LAASPRQIKKVIPLRSLRLRGEISILDKSESYSICHQRTKGFSS
jgi:hypothetical protein